LWETIEPNSHTLILYSTIGYVTAGVILILHLHRADLERTFPRILRVVMWLLAAINLVTGFSVLLTPQPNVGTMTLPLGLLAYTGLFTLVGGLLGIFGTSQFRRRLEHLTVIVLAVALVVSIGWIVIGWLSALVAYFQQHTIIVIVVIVITLLLGVYVRNHPQSTLKHKLIRTTFYSALLAESTFVFVMANYLLVFFLGMVLHP
jgi:hypothetical protein